MTAFLCNYCLLWIGGDSFFLLTLPLGWDLLKSLSPLVHSYSVRRIAIELSAGLRVQLCSSPGSCSPRQADSEKEHQILLSEKLDQCQ